MGMADFTWALGRVMGDWRKRRPKQLRNMLPPSFTSPILRYIRVYACRLAAPDTIECKKWSQTDPWPSDSSIPSYPLDMEERKGPFMTTPAYVCDECKHPCVTNGDLIGKLGLAEKNVDFSARTLQRYMNAEDQMPGDQFRRVVSNALAQGWLGSWQTIGIMNNADQLDASRKGILALGRRATERKAYRERQELDISQDEIEREFQKQMRLRENEITRTVDRRLQEGDLPPEVRQFMEEMLFEKKTKK
jgi:hypothetical protein